MSGTAARARALAAETVAAVQRGRALDDALDTAFARLAADLAPERALIQEMSYGAVRWHFQLEPLLRGLLDRPPAKKDADLEALLRIGLYQLFHMRVAPHAAVKETVEAAAALGKDWAKGLVNAVLRRALREEGAIRARLADNAALAHPDWLLARVQQAYPGDWRAIAQANNERPPLTLRVNLARLTRAAYLDKLAADGIEAEAVADVDVDSAVTLAAPLPVEALPGFREGEVSVQDAAAQLAAALLEAAPGMRVLDACAAPGGKAAHLLERTPGLALVALDLDAARLERVRDNFRRLGLDGRAVAGDAARPADWWDGTPFDRILLDAPCSATGVIRRHPDIRLHRTPADVARLAAGQARLLAALWPLLAPGGKLLYVTCSILPDENREPLAAFHAQHPDARVEAPACAALARCARADGIGYQILPGRCGMDGFYYARLGRAPAGA